MTEQLPIHRAVRVLSAERRGSSWPVVVETEAGRVFTKLRGAAQGTSALVAEVIVGGLAEALGLRVPGRVLVALDAQVERVDRNGELAALLEASRGINLGFEYLEGARDLRADEAAQVDAALAARVLWLDALVLNRDRTPQNPNVMYWRREPWFIDHGAALTFQHDWAAVSEEAPRSTSYPLDRHLFGSRARDLPAWDARLSASITGERLQAIVGGVPDAFLSPLLGAGATSQRVARRRAAYQAFLWKRLRAPRPFVESRVPCAH